MALYKFRIIIIIITSLPFNGRHPPDPCNYMDHYSFTDPRGMEGWVGLVGWPIPDALPMKWSHVYPRIRRRSGKVRQLQTDVLTTEPRHAVYGAETWPDEPRVAPDDCDAVHPRTCQVVGTRPAKLHSSFLQQVGDVAAARAMCSDDVCARQTTTVLDKNLN